MRLKTDLAAEVRVVRLELQHWIKENHDANLLRQRLIRWGCRRADLDRFLAGKPTALSNTTLSRISRDSSIPIARLIGASEAARLVDDEITISPWVVGDGPVLPVLIMPRGTDIYRDRDFDDRGFWVRACKEWVSDGTRECVIDTGLKILSPDDFVFNFKPLRPSATSGRITNLRGTLHVHLLTFGGKCDTIRYGVRVGLVTVGVATAFSTHVYRVPKAGEEAARRL